MESSGPVTEHEIEPGHSAEQVPLPMDLNSHHSFGTLAHAYAGGEENSVEKDVEFLEAGVSGVHTLDDGLKEEQERVTMIRPTFVSQTSTGDCSERCMAGQDGDRGELHSEESTRWEPTSASNSDESWSSCGEESTREEPTSDSNSDESSYSCGEEFMITQKKPTSDLESLSALYVDREDAMSLTQWGEPIYDADSESSSLYGEDDNIWEDVMTLTHTCETSDRQSKIYIIGTAHVSQVSSDQVARLIKSVKPEAVVLELCRSRAHVLCPGEKFKVPTYTEMLHAWIGKRMTALDIVDTLYLIKAASKLKVLPGAEFRVAFEEAKACGAHVFLGDRPLQVTMLRKSRMMSFKEKARYILLVLRKSMFLPGADDLRKSVEKFKDTNIITEADQVFRQNFPTMARILFHEREQYMVAAIRATAKGFSSVVVVVGKGHVAGIVRNWDEHISLESLLFVPPHKPASKLFWGLATGGLVALAAAYLAYRRSHRSPAVIRTGHRPLNLQRLLGDYLFRLGAANAS